MTLEELAAAVDRAPSQLSMIENGRREPKLTLLQTIARALGTTLDALLESEPLDERATLEIGLERAMRGQTFQALGIPPFRIGKTVPTEALKAMLALQGEIERLRDERAATPEEARRANVALRQPDAHAEQLLRRARGAGAAHPRRGRPPRRSAHAADGIRHRRPSRIHAALRARPAADHPQRRRHQERPALPLEPADVEGRPPHGGAAGAVEPDARPPRADELRRVPPPARRDELPHRCAAHPRGARRAVPAGREGATGRSRSRICATPIRCRTRRPRTASPISRPVHLGIPVHFLKVHESGTITKAYENDDVNFPTDRLGAIEGQMCCRRWTSRVVFDEDDHFNPYYQYTDTGNGTYWCTARVEASSEGAHSVSVGVRFDDTKWFLGRDTPNRGVSKHSVEVCCRRAPADLEARVARPVVAERAHPAHAARDAADRRVPGRRHDRRLRVPRGARPALTSRPLQARPARCESARCVEGARRATREACALADNIALFGGVAIASLGGGTGSPRERAAPPRARRGSRTTRGRAERALDERDARAHRVPVHAERAGGRLVRAVVVEPGAHRLDERACRARRRARAAARGRRPRAPARRPSSAESTPDARDVARTRVTAPAPRSRATPRLVERRRRTRRTTHGSETPTRTSKRSASSSITRGRPRARRSPVRRRRGRRTASPRRSSTRSSSSSATASRRAAAASVIATSTGAGGQRRPTGRARSAARAPGSPVQQRLHESRSQRAARAAEPLVLLEGEARPSR